jgi:hypothetical protein
MHSIFQNVLLSKNFPLSEIYTRTTHARALLPAELTPEILSFFGQFASELCFIYHEVMSDSFGVNDTALT